MMNRQQRVFVDTGAFYAIKDLDDAHHRTGQFIRAPRA